MAPFCFSASIASTCAAIDAIARSMYSSGSLAAQRQRFVQRHAIRHIAVERVVRAGLIGQNVGNDVPSGQLRQDVGAIADQSRLKSPFIFAALPPADASASSSECAI